MEGILKLLWLYDVQKCEVIFYLTLRS